MLLFKPREDTHVSITSQSLLSHAGVQITHIVATIMVLYGWHAVWEAWLADLKKENITLPLVRAGILTVAAVSVWYFV